MSSRADYRYGVSEFTTWPWPFEQDVENYAALGVDAIEICEFKLDADTGRAREQIAMAQAAGLAISSVQPRLHSLYPDQPRPEPAEPAERMALYRRTIDLFGEASPGATLVTITGAAPNGNYREALKTAAREYRLLANYASDHGLRIAVEPLNPILMNVDTFICSLPDALRIVQEVDRPNFGVWLDVWHVWQDAAATQQIAACGDRIFGVHVNDWHTPRHFGDRAVIGAGEIPLPKLLRAIRDTGYSEPYTLELFSSEWLEGSLWRGDLRQTLRQCKASLDAAWKIADSPS